MTEPYTSSKTSLHHAALVHRLGGESCVVPVPAGPDPSLLEVGSLGGLTVWSCHASHGDAVRHARRLARRGHIGILLADDPSGNHLHAAVTIEPVRLCSTTPDGAALPLQRVARMAATPRASSLEQAIALAEALDVDAAGRQTFRLLHRLLHRAVEALPGRVPLPVRHTWMLTQVTRLLFLRFVESEGWLNGNPRFLATAFDNCLRRRRDPARHLLQPLFFGTLNRSYESRSRFARDFGAIPFLNGGLFEPHTVERAYALHLPTEQWRDTFEALVDRVDVSLDPNAAEGRVTPELLGRVFEGVMDPLERKQDGTFFTPPALVDAVLRETIACHLSARLGQSEELIHRGLEDPDPELCAALLDITVLDPAAGSGAFLVAALGLLHGPGEREAARVGHLVTRRLYGVDRHPGAVRLAELRLWLEVLRAMRGCRPEQVAPLPNLDASVRAGDALLDPLKGNPLSRSAARRVGRGHRGLAGVHGTEKRAVLREIRDAERHALTDALKSREAVIDHEIRELIGASRGSDLFNERPQWLSRERRHLTTLRRELALLRGERRRLARDAVVPAFALEVAFAPIMALRRGFDLVVGNPPWVRAERLPERLRVELAARYRWWRSGGTGWRHQPDLAVAFIERGFNLLAPGGTLAMVLPSKVATAGYGAPCRAALATRASLHRVADLANDPRAGFEATTYPLALIASKRYPAAGHVVHLGLSVESPAQPQSAWRDQESWALASPEAQRVAARLTAQHPVLAEEARAHLGVKTGANRAYLNPPEALREWCRPALRGRDVRAFDAKPGAQILWPANSRGEPWTRLPAPVLRHLAQFESDLRRRVDQQQGPWWQLFRTRAATAEHRVAWSDLARKLKATVITDRDTVPLNSCYVATARSEGAAESLAAWLNCTWIRALARLSAEPAAGGCARFGARAVGRVPLPAGVLGSPVLVAFAHTAKDHSVQDALDDHAAELLGLDAHDKQALAPLASDRC